MRHTRQGGERRSRARDDPGRPLAWHLGLLCAALLLPLVTLGGAMLLGMAGAERAQHEAVARQAAGRLAVALDRGLAALGAMAEVLATSDHLREGDLDAFRRRAERLPRAAGGDFVLRDAAGTVLAASDAGTIGQRDPAAEQAALATGRPQFTGLLHTAEGAPVFAVLVAVPGGGAATPWLLSLRVPVAALGRVLANQGIPEGMIATVSDRAGTILARSRDAARFVGTTPRPVQAPDGQEGWRRGTDADGMPIVMAYARAETAGWTAWVFLPEAEFVAPLRRSLLALALAGALMALLAAALALAFARRIAQPISALAAAAGGSGEASFALTPVREVNALARTFLAARAEAVARARAQDELLATLDFAQVLVRDPAGRITTWTTGMERLTLWPREVALGRDAHRMLRTGFPAPLAAIEAELLEHGAWQGELRQRRRDGTELVVASRWALRRGADGTPLAVLESCTDVTALRQAEARLRDAQGKLRHAVRLNEMGALAAALAHEVNQPLTAAAAYAEAALRLLDRGGAPDRAALRETLREAAEQAVHAGRIVRGLRDFVSASDGTRAPAELNALVRDAVALALAGEHGVAVRLGLAEGLPAVTVDAVQIQQVVVNLVRNAVEAMAGAARRELAVETAEARPGLLAVSVSDTGPGVPEEVAARLFTPFVTSKPGGMGVGLSISRAIVEEHGGRLESRPNPGGGSVFRFTLPAAPAREERHVA